MDFDRIFAVPAREDEAEAPAGVPLPPSRRESCARYPGGTLRRKASKGDVNAARELREWRDREAATMQGDGWMYVLTPEQRHTLRGWIAEGLARAE